MMGVAAAKTRYKRTWSCMLCRFGGSGDSLGLAFEEDVWEGKEDYNAMC